jgi:hypothetical protein
MPSSPQQAGAPGPNPDRRARRRFPIQGAKGRLKRLAAAVRTLAIKGKIRHLQLACALLSGMGGLAFGQIVDGPSTVATLTRRSVDASAQVLPERQPALPAQAAPGLGLAEGLAAPATFPTPAGGDEPLIRLRPFFSGGYRYDSNVTLSPDPQPDHIASGGFGLGLEYGYPTSKLTFGARYDGEYEEYREFPDRSGFNQYFELNADWRATDKSLLSLRATYSDTSQQSYLSADQGGRTVSTSLLLAGRHQATTRLGWGFELGWQREEPEAQGTTENYTASITADYLITPRLRGGFSVVGAVRSRELDAALATAPALAEDDETSLGARVVLDWEITGRLALAADVGVDRRELATGDTSLDPAGNIALTHQISPRTSWTLAAYSTVPSGASDSADGGSPLTYGATLTLDQQIGYRWRASLSTGIERASYSGSDDGRETDAFFVQTAITWQATERFAVDFSHRFFKRESSSQSTLAAVPGDDYEQHQLAVRMSFAF